MGPGRCLSPVAAELIYPEISASENRGKDCRCFLAGCRGRAPIPSTSPARPGPTHHTQHLAQVMGSTLEQKVPKFSLAHFLSDSPLFLCIYFNLKCMTVFACMFVCALLVCVACRGQKRKSELLGQVALNHHHVGAGTRTRVGCKSGPRF